MEGMSLVETDLGGGAIDLYDVAVSVGNRLVVVAAELEVLVG